LKVGRPETKTRLVKSRRFIAAAALLLATLAGCVFRRVIPGAGNPAVRGVEVTWHGHSCFSFRDGSGRVVVIDPYDESVGYQPLKLTADALLITHDHFDHNNAKAVWPVGRQSLRIVDSTGTVQVGGLEFQGLQADHDNQGGIINGPTLIFIWTMGGLKIAHLGDMGQKSLTPVQKQVLQGVDVLFVPIGGFVTLDAIHAYKIVQEIAPRVVIPMHYGRPEVRFYPLDPVDPFLKLFPPEQVHRFKGATIRFTKSDLTDGTVVCAPESFTSTNFPQKERR
jgi:L-ascorbate metabolism protein UlaG (beta-lactamase superfamily)